MCCNCLVVVVCCCCRLQYLLRGVVECRCLLFALLLRTVCRRSSVFVIRRLLFVGLVLLVVGRCVSWFVGVRCLVSLFAVNVARRLLFAVGCDWS